MAYGKMISSVNKVLFSKRDIFQELVQLEQYDKVKDTLSDKASERIHATELDKKAWSEELIETRARRAHRSLF